MFKKLRNKFLVINMTLISVLMLGTFLVIYVMTVQDIGRQADMQLQRGFRDIQKNPPDTFEADRRGGGQAGIGSALPVQREELMPPPERSLSFSIDIDESGAVIQVNSIFDLGDETYNELVLAAISKNSDKARFSHNDNHWMYEIKQIPGGSRIVFLDFNQQNQILLNLIYTFAMVGGLSLCIIFLISLFFANKAILPIKLAWERQEQFVADASHELKTPLAVINTNADAILANPDEPVKNQVKWIRYIKTEVERMSRLTNDLLYLAQLDYNKQEYMPEIIHLSKEVSDEVLIMETGIYEKGIRLTSDIKPDIYVSGNAEQIRQVIVILMDNAIKYTKEGDRIDISLTKSENAAVFKVKNTGEGIPPEEIGKIFDRFYRADKSRSGGGYGLGLSIAKAIAENHKGSISASSVYGKEAIFKLWLPLS